MRLQSILVMMVFLSACQSSQKKTEQQEARKEKKVETEQKSGYIPKSTGKEFEVLVVGDHVKSSPAVKEAIESIMFREYPGLPQPENWFSPSLIASENFNSLHKKHKSIMILITGDQSKLKSDIEDILSVDEMHELMQENHLLVKEDVWSRPQIVMLLHAANDNQLADLIKSKSDEIIDKLDEAEEMRLVELMYPPSRDKKETKNLQDRMGFAFMVPDGYKLATMVTGEDHDLKKAGIASLAWYRLDTKKSISNLMEYSKAVKNIDEMMKVEEIIKVRNEVGKVFVDGPSKGSYMQVEQQNAEVQTKEVKIEGHLALKLTGLWKIVGDQMGGPFVLYAIPDSENNRIIYLDGFVYAAGSKKKPFIKRVETALKTFSM